VEYGLSGFNPISAATSRGLWEWCGLRGFLSGCGDLQIVKELHQHTSSFFFVFGMDVVFLTRWQLPVCNKQRQADSGRSGSGGVSSTRSEG
jgi:hypothetical protein